MDRRLLVIGIVVLIALVGVYFYLSNKEPMNETLPEFREKNSCDQFLTETDLESVIGGKWTSPSNLARDSGSICTITLNSGGRSIILSASPSVISGVNVYDLLHSNLKDDERISNTNEVGNMSFRVNTNNVKKVVFQKGDMVFIISGSRVDFNDIVGVGRIVENRA